MPRNITTGVFTRVSNSFSNPVYGTVIDPTDADALFDDYDSGLTFTDSEPLMLLGSNSGAMTILAPDTASGTITLPAGTTDFSATGGTGQVVQQATAGAPFTVGKVSSTNVNVGVRTLKDAAAFTLTAADVGKLILVDTQGSVAQGEITITLPPITDLSNYSGAWFIFKKVMTNFHPGKMVITPPITATTTGSISASSTALTVASGTSIATNQIVLAIDTGTFRPLSGIKTATRVSAVAGTSVTISQTTVNALSSATINFYTDSIDGGGPRAFEISGQAIAVYSDGVNNWNVVPIQMASLGTPITGHHVVGAPYSVASPWSGDPSTANTQMWEFTPETAGGGTGSNIKVNLPAPSLMVQDYNPATISLMRADTYSSYYPLFYTPNSTWNQANTPIFPFTLNDFGDVVNLYTDGDEYRTLSEFDAHKSWINNISISGTTSPRTSNTLASASATIYAVPYLGDHIYLPGSPAGSTNFVWQNRRVRGTVSHLLSSSTYGYAASANAVHNAYMWVATDGSLQLFLGAANAGSSEYTKLDGINVNASSLAGGVAAKSARLVAFVTTNGSSLASYIADEVIAPTQFTGRIGINAAPPISSSGLTVKISTVPGDGYSSIGLTDDSTYTASLQSDAGGTRLKHVNSAPLYFGTNNTDRLIVAADGGIYTNNATSGSRGIDTINAKGLYIDAQAVSVAKATTQVFTSGSGTYTTPAGVKWIEVFLVGGGGGGGGSGTGAGGGTGGNGGSTTFSTLTASGGAGGTGAGAAGNAGGGTGTGGSINVTGGAGGGGSGSGTGTTVPGVGGASKWFGTTPSPAIGGNAGLAAPANTGTGGSGASIATSGPVGTGGAGGGYVYAIINSPAASYSYAVGAAGTAGTAGTSGAAGGAGGSGIVQVIEHY